jgi:choline dehydrogenase-like flavoprotein
VRDPIVVVGSGPSGVHFAQTAIERGRRVLMLDVGHAGADPVAPAEDLNGLKARLPDPVAYFLGDDLSSAVLPGHAGEYYGFPPGKGYVFRGDGGVGFKASQFAPLFSFARGGLAEAWTGGCYPFTDEDLAAFPFDYGDLAPHYERVARRIGITGVADDLAPFMPVHGGLMEPLEADDHARDLLGAYAKRRETLNARHGFFLGRSRSAVLSRPLGDRPACDHLGRCLWGCPSDAFYTPSLTLRELRAKDGFEYVSGVRVEHFGFDDAGRIDRVHATSIATGARREFDVGALVLAAGTLCTSKIVLDSHYRATGEVRELPGLCDNRQVLVPFFNTRLVGRRYEPRSYQYHQLAFALAGDKAADHVHGLVTTLKTALIHPIVQNIPTSLAAGLGAFRDLHAALGLVNVNFSDSRRPENRVTLEVDGRERPTRLAMSYRPESGESARIERTLAALRGVLGELGCVAPKGMTHIRPMGASVHYTGTLPMTRDGGTGTVDAQGRARGFENLWIADGATFPSLPAKNLTFTLMANASRIADGALR